MTAYNFSANGIDFGNYSGSTLRQATEAFAAEAGYTGWDAMVEQAKEYGGNSVEIRELLLNGQLGPNVADDV